jgi:hypothetical protein
MLFVSSLSGSRLKGAGLGADMMEKVLDETVAELLKESVKVRQDTYLADKVVFVNGFPGNGKTMLAPIVSNFIRVELMKFNYHLEHIIQLRHLNAIRDDVAISLAKIWTDLDLYNLAMARETNFRLTDLSGVYRNSLTLRYLRRVLSSGDAKAAEQIKRENPILLLTTHMLMVGWKVIHAALGERLRFIELVRHPLYMLRQVRTWMPHSDDDPRSFMPHYEHDGVLIPWWTYGWGDLYARSNMMDKSIYLIDSYYRFIEGEFKAMRDEERELFLTIPFERFVIDPHPYIEALASFMGTEAGSAVKKMMKKQNVPRQMYAEGIGLKIYQKYGWVKPETGSTEQREFAQRREYAAQEASSEAMEVLDRISEEYKNRYLADV